MQLFLYFLELVKVYNKVCKIFQDGVPAQPLSLDPLYSHLEHSCHTNCVVS